MMLHAFDLDLLLRSVHRTDPSCKLSAMHHARMLLESKVYLNAVKAFRHFCEAFPPLFCSSAPPPIAP